MTQFTTMIVGTIVDGSLFALIGIGVVIVFRATGVISFAQGAFMVVGSFLFFTLSSHAGVGTVAAVAATAVGVAIVAGLCYRVSFGRSAGAPPFVMAVATIGLATFVESIAILIWGDQSVILNPEVISHSEWHVADFTLTPADVWTIAMAVVVTAALVAALQRTHVGLQMRAVADESRLAAYRGVNVVGVSFLAWMVAGFTAALAGIAFTMSSQPSPNVTYSLALLAFPAMLLGGFDSIIGVLVGGLLIALIENLTVTYFGGQFENVVAYAVLLVVLFARPQGIFGAAEINRL